MPLVGAADDGAHPLSAFWVGESDHRDIGDFGMLVQQFLDLLCADVLALPDDDVLEAAGDHQRPVGAEISEVAGAEPCSSIEGDRVEGGVDIASEHRRSAHLHFASDAGTRDGAVPRHHPDFDAGGGSAHGVREMVVVMLGVDPHLGKEKRPGFVSSRAVTFGCAGHASA
jgi:hypothetical protein